VRERLSASRPCEGRDPYAAPYMGPGAISAFTRVFDALWAGTTEVLALPSQQIRAAPYSLACTRTRKLLWSTYQTVTGVVELSIQVRRSCE